MPELSADQAFALALDQHRAGRLADAEHRYREIADDPSSGEAGAEALYWAGVARYKATNDPSALQQTAESFKSRFSGSTWAKKASVWTG